MAVDRKSEIFRSDLKGRITNTSHGKWLESLRIYTNSRSAIIRNCWNNLALGYNQIERGNRIDTSPTPSINVTKSCVDTLTSKIAQAKIRPFFDTLRGDFKGRKAAQAAQDFFDQWLDFEHFHEKKVDVFKLAAIFDSAFIHVNPFTNKIDSLAPWQCGILDAEFQMDNLTKGVVFIEDFPATLLKDYVSNWKNYNKKYVSLELFYDTDGKNSNTGKCYVFIDNVLVREIKLASDVVPIIPYYFNDPIVGAKTISLVDELRNIQYEIDILCSKIKNASQLTFESIIAVPTATGDVVAQAMKGSSGYKIIRFEPAPGVNAPLQVITPEFISPQYIEALEFFINQAYAVTGVSQLSAQSMKPTGLDSGIAIQTYQDLETDRFQTQVDKIVNLYNDVVKIAIDIFKDDIKIINNDSSTWKDIRKEKDNLKIQFSASSSLSKDPSKKLEEIIQLTQTGLLPQEAIGSLMDMPDLRKAYSMANSSYEAALAVIDNVCETGDLMIPREISRSILEREVVRQIRQIIASKMNDKTTLKHLGRLTEFRKLLFENMRDNGLLGPITQLNPENAMVASSGLTVGEMPGEHGMMSNNQLDADMQGMGIGAEGQNVDAMMNPQEMMNLPGDPDPMQQVAALQGVV